MKTAVSALHLRGRALAGLAMLAAAATTGAQVAPPNPKAKYRALPEREVTAPIGIVPHGLGREVRVVLELAGAPVAAVQAASPVPLTQGEKDGIADGLEAEHLRVATEVIARGGTVLGSFKHAINGVKVSVTPGALQALRALPDVIAVRPVTVFQVDQVAAPDNAVSVPYIGAPVAWGGTGGFHGDGVKVAVIDTGIDYTHADFGGAGTAAAYQAALAADTLPANPAAFGPGAPKVKGGIDLVGDAYDANVAGSTPAPDPNPLDCNGHGSHVSGTIAGFGVTSAGATYAGPYTTATVASGSWTIGPGVAPGADLYAVKVFGCSGSTDVVVDAIDWAVKNGMGVINMSLGSPFGNPESADAVAAENAARAGVIVVASAGNSGQAPYVTGAPAVGDRVISVAASDVSLKELPTATLGAGGAPITAQVSNGAAVPAATLGVVVLPLTAGGFSGCTESEYAGVAGKLVVTVRGSCARVNRAIFGQKHGAAAVVLVNNAPGFGVFEFAIPGVTIPFLGVAPGDGAALEAATSVSLAAGPPIPNPAYQLLASFSSGGPRRGDSRLKPGITAPGVSINSTAVGTGNQATRLSGTSMASPHVAGTAALALQAHPGWPASEIRAALLATAAPARVADYQARLAGAGMVQADLATATQVVALAQASQTMNLSFGFAELPDQAFVGSDEIEVTNHGQDRATFDVVTVPTSTTPHVATASPPRVTVAPGESATVNVRLTVPAGTAGDTTRFRDVAGIVKLVPGTSSNGGIALRVPYDLVTRARSRVQAEAAGPFGRSAPSVTVELQNQGVIPGSSDFYAWGPSGVRSAAAGEVNLRAAGAQSFDVGLPGDRLIVFAVNTWRRFNTAASSEFDIGIDLNGDGKDDFVLFSFDVGAMLTGSFSGQIGTFVFDPATRKTRFTGYAGDGLAPTDGSTVFLPVMASQIGLSPSSPRFSYYVASFGWEGQADVTTDTGTFNPFTSAIGTGGWVVLEPGARTTMTVPIDAAEWALTPPRGLMIVNLDDHSGKEQAELVPASRP